MRLAFTRGSPKDGSRIGGLSKRYRFIYAASLELNSAAPLSRSQRKRDQISFENQSRPDKNLQRNVIALAETVGSLLSADAGCHKHSQVAPPRLTSTRRQDSYATSS